MREQRELTCIGCPMGCLLSVETEDGAILHVAGNTCPRGVEYAKKELTHPERALSSTVPVAGSVLRMVPVRAAHDIPKDRIPESMAQIRRLRLRAPVKAGEVLIENLAGTGIGLIATRGADCA